MIKPPPIPTVHPTGHLMPPYHPSKPRSRERLGAVSCSPECHQLFLSALIPPRPSLGLGGGDVRSVITHIPTNTSPRPAATSLLVYFAAATAIRTVRLTAPVYSCLLLWDRNVVWCCGNATFVPMNMGTGLCRRKEVLDKGEPPGKGVRLQL